MKEEADIIRRTESYRKELLQAVAEKERLGKNSSGELDLKILSFVHKLEILFWILEIDLPKSRLHLMH